MRIGYHNIRKKKTLLPMLIVDLAQAPPPPPRIHTLNVDISSVPTEDDLELVGL